MKALLIVLGAVSAIAAAATALAFVGLPYRPLGVEFMANNPYMPPSITAQATGSESPTQIPSPDIDDVVVNGDFRILLGAGPNQALGDGINEVTIWDLDFSEDAQFEHFPTDTPLGSAMLTLTLTPKSTAFTHDTIRIAGLPRINPAIYAELPLDSPAEVQLELLDFYSSDEILEALTSNDGTITMSSASNSIVFFAELVLMSNRPAAALHAPHGVNLSGGVLLQGEQRSGHGGTTVNLFADANPRIMRSVTTGADGSFSINLTPGTYRLEAAQSRWQPLQTEVVIADDDLELGPVLLLLEGPHTCPGGAPGHAEAPRILDAMPMSDREDPGRYDVLIDLDQEGLAWVQYWPADNEAAAVTTPLPRMAGQHHRLELNLLQPDALYCYQAFATTEPVSQPSEATRVSGSFPGSFSTGPQLPVSGAQGAP